MANEIISNQYFESNPFGYNMVRGENGFYSCTKEEKSRGVSFNMPHTL